MEIFKLFGSILIDSDAADKSISKTDTNAKKMFSTLGSGVATAAKVGAAVTTAAVAGGTALVGMATSVADTAGDIDDAAKRAGTSAEEYQKWAYAAKLGGMEAATLEKAMVKQQKAFADAKEGSSSLQEAYQRLGVDINNIGNSGDAFNSVMAALADMEDETSRNAIANDIFGKSYAELAPLLAEGAKGIEAWKNEAEELGAVLSDDAVEAGADFGDTIDRIKTAFGGMFNQLGGAIIPLVNTFAQLLLDNIPMIQGLFENIIPVITSFAEQLLPPLMELINSIFPILLNLIATLLPPITEIINMILPIIVDLLNMLMPVLVEILQQLLPPLLDIIKSLLPVLDIVLELLAPILDVVVAILPTLSELLTAIAPLITLILDLIANCLEPLKPLIGIIADLFSDNLSTAIDTVTGLISGITEILGGLIDFVTGVFTGDWEKAWGGIEQIFTGVWDGLQSIATGVLDGIVNGIDGFIDLVNNIPGVDIPNIRGGGTVDAVSGVVFQVPKKFASGGIAYGETLATVGEYQGAANNPEVIAPLDKLSDIMAGALQPIFDTAINKIVSSLGNGRNGKQPLYVVVKLNNGMELASALVDDINQLSRINGGSVID